MKKWFCALAIAALVSGCEDAEDEYAQPIFHSGQIVKMKISGREGMVLATRCPNFGRWPSLEGKRCEYKVRFDMLEEKTDTGWLSDGPIDAAPVATRWIYEFELEPT